MLLSEFAVHEAVSFALKPLLSFKSIDPVTEADCGAEGGVEVSGSAFLGVTGPAVASELFAVSHLSLTLTLTHLGAKSDVLIVMLVDVPT